MGQRAAAKATKEFFNLETFAHTTLGRAFKALEQSIASITKKDNADAGKTDFSIKNRFPKAQDTANRRRYMAVFLKDFNKIIKPEKTNTRECVNEKTRSIVRRYYEEYNRLLI